MAKNFSNLGTMKVGLDCEQLQMQSVPFYRPVTSLCHVK